MPLFCTFQVLVNPSFGFITLPAGMFTSLIKTKLLQPDAKSDGLGVAVKSVPVGVGETLPVTITGTNTSPCVADGPGDGRGNGVVVGVSTAGVDVSVDTGARAVCVSNMDAASVPTPAVRMAFKSVSELSSVAVPPQEASRTPPNNKQYNNRLRTEIM